MTDEETGGDLYEELKRQDAKPLEDTYQDSDDEEEPPTMDWMPPPPLSERRGDFFGDAPAKGQLDILSILVSIYGSKELFVDEYRIMLADKLLSNLDFNTDREVHTLELLKLRFGEPSMRQCEIMIKDIDDSKRILTNIQSSTASASNDTVDPSFVDAAIVSHIFWPKIQKEDFTHHDKIQTELEQFSVEYGKLKNPRRLVWYHQLGTVELELEVLEEELNGDNAANDGASTKNLPKTRMKTIRCNPVQATLISHFEDQEEWSRADLAKETGVSENVLHKRMAFWINQRVVVEANRPLANDTNSDSSAEGTGSKGNGRKGPVYRLAAVDGWVEDDNAAAAAAAAMIDEEPTAIGGDDEAELEVFESYIVGMLKRVKELPLERIHSMLKMFATGSDHSYSKTPRQLGELLQRLCREEKLECGPDGMYKLVDK